MCLRETDVPARDPVCLRKTDVSAGKRETKREKKKKKKP